MGEKKGLFIEVPLPPKHSESRYSQYPNNSSKAEKKYKGPPSGIEGRPCAAFGS